MQKYNGQLIRQFASSVSGNAASGVTVTVRRQSNAGLATLYVDNNIAGATLSNPITTTSTGHFAFYAPDDVYTLTFSDSTPVQVIQLQDVAELQAQFDAAVLNAGYIPSGTFAAGATLTQANQVLSDGSSYWRWDGSLPKVVTAGSAPTPVGAGGWFVVSDFALRGDLAAVDSTVLVGGVEAWEIAQNNKDFVSIAQFMTYAQVAAINGGDTNQVITTAVQAALTSGYKRVSFAGVNAICDIVILSGVTNLDIDGAGAKLRKPAGSGQDSQIFRLLGGCSDIELHDFAELDGGYYSTNAATGTRPVIMIGDESGAGDGGLTNKNIKIYRNTIKGSNWGGIVVYGRSNTAVTLTPKNENISIFMNKIYDCGGNGVFVYKNAYDVKVYHNEIYDVANNGVVFDTMAQSDAVTTEANYNPNVYGNRVYNYGKKGSGAGVQIKGRNLSFKVRDNEIFNSVSDGVSNINYGVFVTRDNALARPYAGSVTGNDIYNLTAFGAAVGVTILGADSVKVIENNVRDTKSQGIQGARTTDLKVIANDVSNAGASVYGFSFIGDVSNRIVNLKCIGNTYKKGAGTSTGGFNYTYVDGLDSHCNDAVDFTTTAELFSNCTTVDFLNQVTQAGAPSAGLQLQGLRQNETSPGLTNPVVQRVNISTGTPGIWRPVSWVVGKNTKANRPTLTANDVGVMFLDTTLDADGKPIWWNGVAWVDATGAVV